MRYTHLSGQTHPDQVLHLPGRRGGEQRREELGQVHAHAPLALAVQVAAIPTAQESARQAARGPAARAGQALGPLGAHQLLLVAEVLLPLGLLGAVQQRLLLLGVVVVVVAGGGSGGGGEGGGAGVGGEHLLRLAVVVEGVVKGVVMVVARGGSQEDLRRKERKAR